MILEPDKPFADELLEHYHTDYHYEDGEKLPETYSEPNDNTVITRIIIFEYEGIRYIMNRNSRSLKSLYPDDIFQYYGHSTIDIHTVMKLNFSNENHQDQKEINMIKRELVKEYNVDVDDDKISLGKFKKALKALVKPLRDEIDQRFRKIAEYILNMSYEERGKCYFYIKSHPECVLNHLCIKDIYDTKVNTSNKRIGWNLKALQMVCFDSMKKNGTIPSLNNIMKFAKGELSRRSKLKKTGYDID